MFRSPDDDNFAAAFEAITVLIQYRLKHGKSLFGILDGTEMEK